MEKIEKLKKIFKREKIDGYIIPKNDEFFGEYVPEYKDRLNFISSFTGSYGFALVLKDKNYLFVDGRYTLQANNQSGRIFKIITVPDKMPSDILKEKKLSIGFDPTLFTERSLSIFFGKTKFKLKPISQNLIDVKTPSFLNVAIKINNKKSNLSEFNDRIKKIDLIDNYYVQQINKDYVLIKIRYLGKIDKIINKLRKQDMNLKMIKGQWQLKII